MYPIVFVVPMDSVLGWLQEFLYTADMSKVKLTTIAIFAYYAWYYVDIRILELPREI